MPNPDPNPAPHPRGAEIATRARAEALATACADADQAAHQPPGELVAAALGAHRRLSRGLGRSVPVTVLGPDGDVCGLVAFVAVYAITAELEFTCVPVDLGSGQPPPRSLPYGTSLPALARR